MYLSVWPMTSHCTSQLNLISQLCLYVHLRERSQRLDLWQNCIHPVTENSLWKLLILNCHCRHFARHRELSRHWIPSVTMCHTHIQHLFPCLTVTMCLVNCFKVPTLLSAGWPTARKSVPLTNWNQLYKIWPNGLKETIHYCIILTCLRASCLSNWLISPSSVLEFKEISCRQPNSHSVQQVFGSGNFSKLPLHKNSTPWW